MTVKDAKEKWCPMGRNSFEGITGNRLLSDALAGQDPHCIADECACWKWDRKTGETTMVNIDPDDWQGHCGLTR